MRTEAGRALKANPAAGVFTKATVPPGLLAPLLPEGKPPAARARSASPDYWIVKLAVGEVSSAIAAIDQSIEITAE
jgi:hypothetical protein